MFDATQTLTVAGTVKEFQWGNPHTWLEIVILEPGGMPLNRTAKVDVGRLQEMAKEEVRKLRERGRWDAG